MKLKAIFSEVKDNFKADERLTGLKKVFSMFVNLWKSGVTGRVTLIASSVVALLLMVLIFRGCGSDSTKVVATAEIKVDKPNVVSAQSAVPAPSNVGTDHSREKREEEPARDQIQEIFALAKTSAEKDFNINFFGFFAGMSRYDAQDLAAYYKLKDDEYSVEAAPGKAVSTLWFSLKGVRRITRGGSTVDELAQIVANRVGDMKRDFESGEYVHRTIDGVVVTMGRKGLSIQNGSVASKNPIVTKLNAQKEANAPLKVIHGIIENMVMIPGKNFMMGKFEVTQAQWQMVMGWNQSEFKGEDNPVECVAWVDCKEFVEKLNALPEIRASGLKFRLPREAEWEYACRAGATGDYCKLVDGTEITKSTLSEVAWCKGNSNTTHPVGQKKPNAFGLYDMHGNVWEWCEDSYKANDPLFRVHRGGSWDSDAGCSTASNRACNMSDYRHGNGDGFRLAASRDE